MAMYTSGLPGLPRLGSYSGRQRAQTGEYDITPDEQESLLRTLGRRSLGGIAAVGNFLDLPGSMVRDFLTGNNPLDQLLSPFSYENRVTGRQLGEKWGLLGQNRKGKLDFGDIAGFGLEVGLDPLTYLTLGGSAVGKAGKAAKAAGLMRYAPKAAPGMGKRVAKMNLTPDDLIKAAPDPSKARSAFKTAGGAGLEAEKLGGLMGVGLPFRDPIMTVGRAGTGAERIARRLDVAGEAVRYGKYSPVRPLAAMFAPSTKGLMTAEGQKLAPKIIAREAEGQVAAREQFADIAADFERTGHFDPESILRDAAHPSRTLKEASTEAANRGRAATRYLEGVDETFEGPNWVRGRLDQMRNAMEDLIVRERAAGLNTEYLDDLMVKYFPRLRFQFATGKQGFGQRLFQTTHPFQKGRKEFLKDHGGGTDILNELSLDDQISGIADNTWRLKRPTTSPYKGSDVEGVRKYILQKYLGPRGITITDKEGKDMLTDLAKWVMNLDPRHADTGVPAFELNPLKPLLARLEHGERAIKGVEGTMELLADNARLPIDRELTDVRLSDLISDAGLSDEAKVAMVNRLSETFSGINQVPEISARSIQPGSVVHAADRNNYGRVVSVGPDESVVHFRSPQGLTADVSLSNELLTATRKQLSETGKVTDPTDVLHTITVPADIAADAGRFLKSFQGPEAAGAIGQAVDWFTNMFKTGVTAVWPAFHVRNFTSGQFQNWVGDAFSMDSLKKSHQLIRGQEIRGLAESVPAFRGMTDKQATAELRKLMFSHDVIHRKHGLAAETLGEAVVDPIGGIPGVKPWKISAPAPVGTTVGEQLIPWNVAGVGSSTDVFAPARYGRNIGHYVESLNRGTPFIELLKKGWSPEEAARKVKLMQVDYTARAALDPAMRRLAPFWSFTRGVVPFTVQQLAERPGGKMAQTIRAIRGARDPSEVTPDYIAETAGVPLAGTPLESLLGSPPEGTNRYFTGAGLMVEDPLSFVGSGFRGAGLEALSRINPLVKGPLEWITGQSFFQKGPQGGRPLEDLDPTIGRTLANIKQLATGEETRYAQPFAGSRGLEAVAANLPITRFLTTARTLSDPRKGALAKAMQLGTGFRIADISPAAQDAMLQERIDNLQKELGGRTFTKTYVPEDVRSQMGTGDLMQTMQLDALERLLRQRKKERRSKLQPSQ